MPIREANFFEIPAIGSICSAAFFEEDLFGRTMHPHRHKYPEDFTFFWQGMVRKNWTDWRKRMLVACTKDEMTGKEKLVGMAIWHRQGEGGKKMELASYDPRKLITPLAKQANTLTSHLYPNRAADLANLDILERGFPFCMHHWASKPDEPFSRSENWYLSLLAVHPDHQGEGFGRELVEWGIKEADNEGVCASVMSSYGTDPFYLKHGFDEVIGDATEGDGNPLKGVKGGSILFRWPKKN
ncbi:hypothetical protein EJ04DRAFT_513568 [Polyplosphaeria fusca]|uniref:N-acetyltransferase domain-containing protein n=1 Tax=Polyplosphaeria fusca TaxID=682080 RepID=A0A9P4QUI7_9PLEO|nr:hypothetical protein EJ04DRAFT_513568 [Polyplosphaeria fusca]